MNDASNEQQPEKCPSDRLLRLIWGAWKIHVLWVLGAHGPKRFGELRQAIEGVTPKVLTDRLRAMESDKLIWCRAEKTRPPKVTYGLTKRGELLHEALCDLHDLGKRWDGIEP